MADETTATEMPVEPSETAVVASVASPKRAGRPPKGSRPKIDIDDEIDEANRLAEVTKKMMQAAKAAQRNSRRTKQRLVRKAGKLSAADLERIATLKRCGLFVADPTEPSTSSTSSAASSSSGSSAQVSNPVRRVNTKLFSAVGQVQGAADLLASMKEHVPVAAPAVASGAAVATSASSAVAALPLVPRGRRLMPATASSTSRPVSPSASASAEAMPAEPAAEERESPEADDDHDDDAM